MDKETKPQCICCFLASNPYACKACWPDGGSEKERSTFLECIAKEREAVGAEAEAEELRKKEQIWE